MNKKIILCLLSCLTLFLGAESALERAENISELTTGVEFLENWEAGAISWENNLPLGVALHQLSQIDTETYGQKALDVLESVEGAEALAYHGSVLTLMAGLEEERNPVKAILYLQEGAQEIDQAVASDPEFLDLRILRLVNGIEVSLTSPHQRFEDIQEDGVFILAWLNDDASITVEEKSCYYFYLGELELGLGHWDLAFEYMEKAIDAAPQSDWALRADDRLFLLEE